MLQTSMVIEYMATWFLQGFRNVRPNDQERIWSIWFEDKFLFLGRAHISCKLRYESTWRYWTWAYGKFVLRTWLYGRYGRELTHPEHGTRVFASRRNARSSQSVDARRWVGSNCFELVLHSGCPCHQCRWPVLLSGCPSHKCRWLMSSCCSTIRVINVDDQGCCQVVRVFRSPM